MTERDTNNAQPDRHETLERKPSSPPRRVTIAAAAAVALVVGFVGVRSLGQGEKPDPVSVPPQASGIAEFLTRSALTPELFEGLWRLFSDPAASGIHVRGSNPVTLTLDSRSDECAGEAVVARASAPFLELVHLGQVDPSASGCPQARTVRVRLDGVLPTDPYLLEMDLFPDEEWQPPDLRSMYGFWLAVGGGYALELGRDGTFFVTSGPGELVDVGQWALAGSPSQLTLVSSAASPTCHPGDRVLLGRPERTGGFFLTGMRVTVESNTCGGAWARNEWFLVPHSGRH